MSKRIYIKYETSHSGGKAINPDDRWTDHEDEHIHLKVKKLLKSEPKDSFFNDSIEVEDEKVFSQETVYLVVVRYHDGGTFGTTYGYHQFYSVRATLKEAEADEKEIRSPKSSNAYRSWDGYFAGLDDVDIMPMILFS